MKSFPSSKPPREAPSAPDAGGWVRYRSPAPASSGGDRWLGVLGLHSFRMLLWLAIATLAILVGLGLVLRQTVFWADVIAAGALAAVLLLVTLRPGWFRPLTWVVLAVLALDTADGLFPGSLRPVTPSHVLMPMLVLYGALLCDLAVTVAALALALGLCALTWARHAPLSSEDAMMLSHVVLVTSISGLTALAIWMHHRRLLRALRRQAEELRTELATNRRLNAVIFHDIANPLTALAGTLELGRIQGAVAGDQVTLMTRMVERIASIIKSVRAAAADLPDRAAWEEVSAERMVEELREVFEGRLRAKGQTLSLAAGSGPAVKTVPGILLNSVLGNLLSNAIKFSPPGGAVGLRVAREGERVRVEIHDQGGGFPPELLRQEGDGPRRSRPGTEGEPGHGHGLEIAALYAAKLGGTLELMNRRGGGASVAVVLPLR